MYSMTIFEAYLYVLGGFSSRDIFIDKQYSEKTRQLSDVLSAGTRHNADCFVLHQFFSWKTGNLRLNIIKKNT